MNARAKGRGERSEPRRLRGGSAAEDAPSDRRKSEALVDDLTLQRARRGDNAAFRVLVERYQEPVFALVGRILLGGGAVEDVAQETFVRVYHGLSRFGADGRLNLTAWILTIAARLAIDEVRRRRAGRTDYEDLIDHADERARADAGLERRRIGGAIVRAVDALAPEYRAAFLLYEIHGLDYEEIARSLDIDLGTVKSRLSRARAALRAALSGLHDET